MRKIASAAIAATCLCSSAFAQVTMPVQSATGQQRFAHQPPPAAFEACVGRPVGTSVVLTPPGRAPIAARCVTGPTGVLFALPQHPPFGGVMGQAPYGGEMTQPSFGGAIGQPPYGGEMGQQPSYSGTSPGTVMRVAPGVTSAGPHGY
jgi:hypothetical protein